jgi:NADH-quinone oxidoreductase subunit G
MEISETVTIHIEGKPFKAEKGQNLLHACLALGFDVPHFCWHPALGSVGSCRLCAVKKFRDEKDTKGEIVMACMTPVGDGMRISIADPEAAEFRAEIISFLMVNHPHDCPVCDEGGECHLQDMTVMTGHTIREYRFRKRTHRNQNLGPFINHEMNRCIQCYRCVRYYRNVAGGRDLNVFGSHDRLYFGRHEDGVLESPFSGNLVEICPTGTFTDKTQKAHNTRNWDLQAAPSVCVHCGLGCNTLLGERYGILRRIRNRYNHDVNGYFLCDRGRFGYEFVNSKKRLKHPLFRARRTEALSPADRTKALAAAARLATQKGRILGIGSPRASLESNAALRSLVGPERFYAGVSTAEHRLLNRVVRILSSGEVTAGTIREASMADAVLVLGEDVTATSPRLALALRETATVKAVKTAAKVQLPAWDDAGVREVAQDGKADLFIAASHPTGLDDAAMQLFLGTSGEVAGIGFDVEAVLAETKSVSGDGGFVERVVSAFKNAERPVVIAGISQGNPGQINAAASIVRTLARMGKQARIIFCVPECNSMGLALFGAESLEQAFAAVENGDADTVVVLENDLYRRAASKKIDGFLSRAGKVLVLDHIMTRTSAAADLVLPVASFAEGSGTLVNNEGRAQGFHAVMAPAENLKDAFRILTVLQDGGGTEITAASILQDLGEELPVFKPLLGLLQAVPYPCPGGRVPRQSFGYSGRTAMNAHENLHEPRPPEDPDAPLAYSMEGFDGIPPSGLVTRYHAPGWNSVQALMRYQASPGGPLKGGGNGVMIFTPGGNVLDIPDEMTETEAAPSVEERVLVPLYHVFGSEELSMASPSVAVLAPVAHAALAPGDPLSAKDARVRVTGGDLDVVLPVIVVEGLCPGSVGIPPGVPGVPALPVSRIVRLTKEGNS